MYPAYPKILAILIQTVSKATCSSYVLSCPFFNPANQG